MGYFPLPELKGKPNRILVDGKTLNQIAKEAGVSEAQLIKQAGNSIVVDVLERVFINLFK